MVSFIAGALCLDFANSVDTLLATGSKDPPEAYARVAAWYGEHRKLPGPRTRALIREAGRRPRTAKAVVERARALGDAVDGIFRSRVRGRSIPADGLAVLNQELSLALREARVVLEGGRADWGWAEDAGALDRILWPIARSAADLLVSEDLDRVRVCAQDTCDWLFLDMSRNSRRRWCDMKTCGNRAKVRRFRERRRSRPR
jgi:predicted RNA-binding Zn ribbon-like protein